MEPFPNIIYVKEVKLKKKRKKERKKKVMRLQHTFRRTRVKKVTRIQQNWCKTALLRLVLDPNVSPYSKIVKDYDVKECI